MSEFINPAEKLSGKKPEPRDRTGRRMYREQFTGERGVNVLTQMLNDMHFLQECKTDDERTLRDYATFIIRDRIGINDVKQLKRIVRLMLEIGE